MTLNPVVHFEMPYEDRPRMVDFYGKAFGWKPKLLGPEMGNYAVMTTTEMGEDSWPIKKGVINGGFFVKTPDNQHPSIVIAVDDIRAAMKRVTEAGGKILTMEVPGEPLNIPGIGLYVGFVDTEGNRVSLLQPSPMPQ